MNEEYRQALREFMAKKGRAADINPDADWPSNEVSVYGWTNFEQSWHCQPKHPQYGGDGCEWIVPEGARLVERTYSQFTDTFHDNEDEVGINVHPVHCKCGKYSDVTLRFTGSLQEVLESLFGPKDVEDGIVL